MDSIQFAGLTFRGLRREILLRDSDEFRHIITVNGEAIVRAHQDPEFASLINTQWSTLDGQWPFWLARFRSRRKDLEKISGSDFVYELCEFASRRDFRVYLLGANPSVNARARKRLNELYGTNVAGMAPPPSEYPFPDEVEAEICRRISRFRPHILVVAFGMPKQEQWISDHRVLLETIGVRWAIGVGGGLDFVAGELSRAPGFVQRVGLESLWRLAQEPRQRFRRVLQAVSFLQYA